MTKKPRRLSASPKPVGRFLFSASPVCAVSALALLCAAPAASAAVTVIDVIPNAVSAEVGQNSEPSIAVNPTNPMQMVSGAFSSTFVGNDVSSPFWSSANGGTTWTGFGSLPSSDKTLAWEQSGAAPLAATLNVISNPPLSDSISTFQGGPTNFGSAVNTTAPGTLDQPWIRTGPSGQTYLAVNNLANAAGKTASLLVSSTNGATYGAQVTLEGVAPAGGQDAPSVRLAVNGSTVYAAFTRWGAASATTGGFIFPGSQVVVTKSTDSGATFVGGACVACAATTTGYFSQADNSPLTLGQERTGSDVAIAVDPNNANHVLVAYGNVPGAGQLQLNVVESTDGGATWSAPKYTTPLGVRSALPGLTITADGQIGLLFASYDPGSDLLSQHLVTTSDDFATTTDNLLGTQSNATPLAQFDPYLGDFYDLTSVGDTMYGIFSASNDDNGILASYPDAIFQRNFSGTPGTANFQLLDLANNPVALSIDPFFFSFTSVPVIPEPATMTLLGTALLGLAALRRRRR